MPTDQEAMGRAASAGIIVALQPTECPMPQPNDLSRSLAAPDQDSTLIAVIEMSQASWLSVRSCSSASGTSFFNPGSQAKPAPRNDHIPAFFRTLLEALGYAQRPLLSTRYKHGS